MSEETAESDAEAPKQRTFIPFPSDLNTNAGEARWLADTITLRTNEALAAAGVSFRFSDGNMQELLLLALDKATKRGSATRPTAAAEVPDPCLVKRETGEPMFVLLARDSAAPRSMQEWCAERTREIKAGVRPDTPEEREHIAQILEKVVLFHDWREKNRGQ